MAIISMYQICVYCPEKGSWSDHRVLGQEECIVSALLTPERNPKDKKKKKSDQSEKGDKLFELSSVTVIGPSASASNSMDTTDILPLQASNPASSNPSIIDFADFKDQFSSHFTRLEADLTSVGAVPVSPPKPVFSPIRVRVSHSPTLQPTSLTSVTASLSTNPVQFPSSTSSVDQGLKSLGFVYATRPGIKHTAVSTAILVISAGPADRTWELLFVASMGSATGLVNHQQPPQQTLVPDPVPYQPEVTSSATFPPRHSNFPNSLLRPYLPTLPWYNLFQGLAAGIPLRRPQVIKATLHL